MYDQDGERAIEQALLAAHPDARPVRFAIPNPGKHELAGGIAVRVETPVPHWLVVSLGFTELHEKVEEDPDVSGWGFELTCRLPARSEELDFGWIVSWMQDIADHIASQVTVLEPYQHMTMWKATSEDEIAAVVFVDDVDLPPTESKFGSFTFLQMVGLTSGEYEALHSWDAAALCELIRARDPLFLMDAQRKSYLRDPSFARAVEVGRERDGSSTDLLHGLAILWFDQGGEIHVHLDGASARAVQSSVKARLSHGKPMTFYGGARKTVRPDGSLALHSQVNIALYPEVGPSEITEVDGRKIAVIRLDDRAVRELGELLSDEPGTYVLPSLPRVRFVVTTAERLREPQYPS